MKLGVPRSSDPEINLTPLIDVVFLLLIFFMVSTTFERDTEIDVELPEADGESLKVDDNMVEISIDASGNYYVDRMAIRDNSLVGLRDAITAAIAGKGMPPVILSADRMTPHQWVVRAMDAAQQSGVEKLTFATSRPGQGG